MDSTALHKKALALFASLQPTKREASAKRTVSGYNERRREDTEALRPVLTEMDERMKAGETFGGCGSMKEYCKTFKSEGCLTYARVRQIITGKSGNEGKLKVKSLDLLKELITVVSNGSPKECIDKANAICGQINWFPKAWTEEMEDREAQREAERANADNAEQNEDQRKEPIKIKLTEAQVREAQAVVKNSSASIKGKVLVFEGDEYQDAAKAFVLRLEERIAKLQAEANEQRKTLKDYNDKSPENVAAFEEQARLRGAIKACEGAIRHIVYGKETDSNELYDWYEQRMNEQDGLSPVAEEMEKTLAPTTDAVSVPRQDCPTDEQITESTPNGYYAKLNRKPKGATQESQPWEIYLTIHGKSNFCARERSKQDAEARCWKLDRIAEEEKQNTPTTVANEAMGAAAM